MKRTFVAFLSLCLASASVEAQICYDVCPAMILPDVPSAALPLTGWVHTSPGIVVQVIEPPQFGIWKSASETYNPSPQFWDIGVDRMKIRLGGNPQDERTIIFQKGIPYIESEQQVFNPAVVFTSQSTAGSVSLGTFNRAPGSILTNGVATVGGYVNASAVPPPLGGNPGGNGVATVLELDDFAHVDLVATAQGLAFSATVDLPALECGSTCVTTPLPAIRDLVYDITLTLGYDSALVPTATDLTLRLEICESGGGACQDTAITGLTAVNLNHLVEWRVGILGGDTEGASLTVSGTKLWRASLPGDVPASIHEGFTHGQQGFWSLLGPIAATAQTQDSWVAQVNLQTMDANSRAWITDSRPTGQKRLRMLIDLDLSSLNLSESEYLLPFHGQGSQLNGAGKSMDLLVRRLNGVYNLRGRVITDAGTIVSTPFIPLSVTKANRLGIHFNSTGDPNEGGTLHLSVDGFIYSLQGIDNDQRHFESLNFGASGYSGAPTFQERLLRFDNLTLVY